MKTLIEVAERRWLPDWAIRIGIRRLLRSRLANENAGNCQANLKKLESLIEDFSSGPIALVPEKANEQHYEVPAAFFELTLGAKRKYSSCCFTYGDESLDMAEEIALTLTCARADIQDGMSVLELGCGWGSLTLWMAEHYPNSRIVAVSNSRSQREYILNAAQERGIDGNLTVVTQDMNEFEVAEGDEFDRVVSVEMFEHMRNYRELHKRISGWLKPAGKLFVHIFCHRELTYPFRDKGQADWMSRYFFSGGNMPGDDLLLRFQDDLSIEHQWRWNGKHYQLTAESWLKNMDINREPIMEVFRETYGAESKIWFQRWRMFFLACSELFGMDGGNQWWVSHYLFTNRKRVASSSSTATNWKSH